MKARSQSSLIRTKRSSTAEKSRAAGEKWDAKRVLRELKRLGERRNVEGMARFGIVAKNVYGVSKPRLDELARKIGRNHSLGLALWETGNHDARILAGMIAERKLVTGKQMERWVRDFDNWDVCDGTCCHLFVFAMPAWQKAHSWSRRKYLEVIEREAWDERNFVCKAVNWALRNIGKRNLALNRAALASAERIAVQGSRAARWIAADALRELKSEAVQTRLRRREA